MTAEANILMQLKELTAEKDHLIPAQVLKVDKSKKTLEVRDLDGLVIPDVRMKSLIKDGDYSVVYPAIDSIVLITSIGDRESGHFLLIGIDHIESVETKVGDTKVLIDKTGFYINEGKLGGVVIADELRKQIDKNSAAINALQEAFSSWVLSPGDGGAALKALTVAFSNMKTADLSKIENEKVKHG